MKYWQTVARTMCQQHPSTAARILESMDPAESAKVLSSLPRKAAASVIEAMSPNEAALRLEHWTDQELKEIAAAVPVQSLGAIWQHLSDALKMRLSGAIESGELRQIQNYSTYVPQSIGAMADPRVLMLRRDLTVREAIQRIRRSPADIVHYLYVVDTERRLVGVVPIRELLLATSTQKLEDIMLKDVVTLSASLDREQAVDLVRQWKFQTLPVVDQDDRFIGIVRTEDLFKVIEQEASEDVQKMFGAGADERVLSPIGVSVRARLPWLVINLATAIAAASVVGLFTDTIAALPVLAALMPIVAGMGGNTGAQSLAVIIRGLALREVGESQRSAAVTKETVVGLLNGLAIALLLAVAVSAWSRNPTYGLVIGVAMVANMTTAGLAGAMIPILLKSLGRDPAQASSIILTTVTDIVGFVVFLGLGTMFAESLGALGG